MNEMISSQAGIKRSLTTGQLTSWLISAGLSFDPFYLLEASEDPYLFAYLVGHDAFEVVWGDWPSFIFAPVGGGKTALRCRVTQACWATQQTNRPFPIVYSPPFLKWGHLNPSFDEHLSALAEAGGLYLLLIMSHRPHWFMRLSKEEMQIVRNTLDWNLPGPLESYICPCMEGRNLVPLYERFQRASLPSDSPSTEELGEFFALLQSFPSAISSRPTPLLRWMSLLRVLLDIFQLPAIYILLDGLDATDLTAENPLAAVKVICSLLDEIPSLTHQRIYFKAFAPIEIHLPLEREYSNILKQAQIVDLIWTPELLAEVIRRRVYVASRGEFGSLSALALPPLRDFELDLAKNVHPLPREILALTHRVLEESVTQGNNLPFITNRDVDAALKWYRLNAVFAQEKKG